MTLNKRFKPIVLVGFMGSGKTTIGALLAQAFHMPFVDIDSKIVEKVQLSIPQIFETVGENGFRNYEYEQLRTQLSKAQVIATGGGIIEHPKSFNLLKQANASIIWLDAPTAVLHHRIQHDANRPNAQDKSFSDLKSLYLSRVSRYNEIAFIKVDTDKPSSEILNEIKQALTANDQY